MPITFTINNAADVLQDGGTLRTDSFGGYSIVPTDLSDTFADKVTDVVSPVLEDQDTTFTDAINEYNGKVNDMYNFLGGETLVTNNLLDDIIDTSVENSPSITNYLNGKVDKGVAGAIWGLQVDSGTGVIAGMELGAMDDGVGNTLSSFKINADTFAVYNSSGSTMLDPDTGEDMPVFFVGQDDDGANFIGFNGKAIFENFIDGNGQTIIDGGHITTDLINVDEVVVGSDYGDVNHGTFPKTVGGIVYTSPTDAYIAAAKAEVDENGKPLLPAGYSLKYGDTYDSNGYEYTWKLGDVWQSVQIVAEGAASSALTNSRDNVAYQLGYSSYSDMVTKARNSGKTIIDGGYLRTDLIDVDTLIVKHIAPQSGAGFEIDADGNAGPSNNAHIYGATIQAGHISADSIDSGSISVSLATSFSLTGLTSNQWGYGYSTSLYSNITRSSKMSNIALHIYGSSSASHHYFSLSFTLQGSSNDSTWYNIGSSRTINYDDFPTASVLTLAPSMNLAASSTYAYMRVRVGCKFTDIGAWSTAPTIGVYTTMTMIR